MRCFLFLPIDEYVKHDNTIIKSGIMATQKSSPNKVSSRLIDYVCFVGVDKSEVSFHDAPFSLYQPQLLKRYPPTDHKVRFCHLVF